MNSGGWALAGNALQPAFRVREDGCGQNELSVTQNVIWTAGVCRTSPLTCVSSKERWWWVWTSPPSLET